MAKKRKAWIEAPAKKSTPSIPQALKVEVESKAADLIENILKPKFIKPPPEDARFNYVSDITSKWYRNYFYLIAVYACPGANAVSPSFEAKFARLEFRGDDRFALSFMRHTEEWVELSGSLSLQECLDSIQNDPWFMP